MSVQIVSASGKNLAQPIAVGSNLTTTPLATLHVLYNATEVDAFRVDDTVNDTTPFVITGQGQGYVGLQQARIITHKKWIETGPLPFPCWQLPAAHRLRRLLSLFVARLHHVDDCSSG